mmetsp:Transcript_4805/g.6347  ORF Transcript_4805/g.6347 Transcript_4805/m.6347 type:complete len:91 (-) Transcript_4805:90-362(-)
MERVKCDFCYGIGHHAGKCSSIKFIDKTVKELRTTRKVWGCIKAKAKSTGKRTSTEAAVLQHMEKEAPLKASRLRVGEPIAQPAMDENGD